MNKTKYMQTDSRWGGLGYPKKPYYLRNCGCGEASICNVIIEMQKYASYTPATIQPYCKQYADPKGNGTYWSGIPAMMKYYGLTEVKEHATMSPLWTELAKGNRVAIYLMGSRKGGSKGVKWTSSGHFVCSTAYRYENGKHYLYVKDSYSNSSLRNGWISYEENMRNGVLKVWSGKLNGDLYGEVTPTSYRPSTPYTGTLPAKTVREGDNNADSKALQTFLNWCINTNFTSGNFGAKTLQGVKVFQKTYGLGVDGIFGPKSKAKAEEIVKEHANTPRGYDGEYPSTTVKTTETVEQGSKIVDKAKTYAWPAGTASSKYSYSKGSAKAAYKTALKNYMGKTAKISQTDCGYFVSTCVRSSGISSSFLALPGSYKNAYPAVPGTMNIVSKGSIGTLKAGDVIRYRKSSGQHTVIYIGDGKIAHASRKNAFPRISSTKPWNNSNVKKDTIQVIRANPVSKTVTRSYLQRGDSGEEIKKLQKYINWFFHNKYGKDVLTVDGKYGVNTENYAKLMQSELGFKDCDGLIGPKTVEAMKGWKQ